MKYLLIFAALLSLSANCFAQNKTEKDFNVHNRDLSIKSEGSDQVFYLNDQQGIGVAWLKGARFTNGTIEVDVKGRDMLQRSFVGIAFHGINDTTYEAIYFRPFNFAATDPERHVHMVQYIDLPRYDWQTLRNTYHNVYEKGINPAPDVKLWFHAKIEVHGDSIKVFVNGALTPSLTFTSLTHPGGTMIGYWAGTMSDGSWKNLKIVAKSN